MNDGPRFLLTDVRAIEAADHRAAIRAVVELMEEVSASRSARDLAPSSGWDVEPGRAPSGTPRQPSIPGAAPSAPGDPLPRARSGPST